MQIKATRNDIYHMGEDIRKLKIEQPTIAMLLHRQIGKFLNDNDAELSITNARFKAILRKYAETDDHGNMLTEVVNGTTKWKFKSSYQLEDRTLLMGRENVEIAFNQECKKLMHQQILITLP